VSTNLSVSAPVHLKRRSVARRAASAIRIVLVLLLLLLLTFSLWNLAVARRQHVHNPVPGNFYSVEGRQMHLYCSGTGWPTIVIEAAAGANSLGWQGVQSKLSPLTRICTYDRAGHGWSQPRPGPRDAETIVRELHELLDQAGVQRPLVLTGHSAGGLYIRANMLESFRPKSQVWC
jgi:pimeloyl-ACP methyl ester carboxylesterase